MLLYAPDQSAGEIVVVAHVLPLAEAPGYDGGPFVSLSIEPRREVAGEDVAKELALGSFGGPGALRR